MDDTANKAYVDDIFQILNVDECFSLIIHKKVAVEMSRRRTLLVTVTPHQLIQQCEMLKILKCMRQTLGTQRSSKAVTATAAFQRGLCSIIEILHSHLREWKNPLRDHKLSETSAQNSYKYMGKARNYDISVPTSQDDPLSKIILT